MTPVDSIFQGALSKLLVEIFDGPPGNEAYVLNPGDPGLIRQLESIDSAQASKRSMPGNTTIASHADHVHYGLTLINRWAAGEENPWADADWDASWKRTKVDEKQWRELLVKLQQEAKKWQTVVATRAEWNEMTAAGAILAGNSDRLAI
jgi:hypothetical protein